MISRCAGAVRLRRRYRVGLRRCARSKPSVVSQRRHAARQLAPGLRKRGHAFARSRSSAATAESCHEREGRAGKMWYFGLALKEGAPMSKSAFAKYGFAAAVSCRWPRAGLGPNRRDSARLRIGAFSRSIPAPILIASFAIGAQITSEKRPWGGSNGVAVDKDGKTVWATDRCSPGTSPGCLGTKANPVHHFDGTARSSRFGGGMSAAARHPCRRGRQCPGGRSGAAEQTIRRISGRREEGSVVISSVPRGR